MPDALKRMVFLLALIIILGLVLSLGIAIVSVNFRVEKGTDDSSAPAPLFHGPTSTPFVKGPVGPPPAVSPQ